MEITIRQCQASELEVLRNMAIQTYESTFRSLNTPANMKAYLEEAFNVQRLQGELNNPNSTFFFIFKDQALAGYMKLNEMEAQTDLQDPAALEIERIYVKAEFQGDGLGKRLIQEALTIAHEANRQFVWLGVWEKNQKAVAFYQKMGFQVVGTHEFIMGDDHQTDFIMRLDLDEHHQK